MSVLENPLETFRLNCMRVLVSALQNPHLGVSSAQKGYVGHPVDLLTSIFGFYAFVYVEALIRNWFQGVHANPFFRRCYIACD